MPTFCPSRRKTQHSTTKHPERGGGHDTPSPIRHLVRDVVNHFLAAIQNRIPARSVSVHALPCGRRHIRFPANGTTVLSFAHFHGRGQWVGGLLHLSSTRRKLS